MIEQQNNLLLISFSSPEAAAQAKMWMEIAVVPWLSMVSQTGASSEPPSDQSHFPLPSPTETKDSLEPSRSRHVVLTEERQEQLFNQQQQGMTAHQRVLRAQTTLRDGVLPFSKPGQQSPQPSGQPSPRQKAAQEGGFADGRPEGRVRGSKMKPQASPKP